VMSKSQNPDDLARRIANARRGIMEEMPVADANGAPAPAGHGGH
jgi:hypothetical protein